MTNPQFKMTAPIALRAARIWSGLFLLAFVTSHLTNLSLGLISIDAMDAARPYLSGLWTGPITGFLLMAALTSHFFLGLWALFLRPTLRTNAQDIVQLLTGVIVVPLLATHAIGVSMVSNAGMQLGYADTIRLFWLQSPGIGLMQVVMLSVVWVHGSAGLFTWLRSKENAQRLLNWLYLFAVIVPVVALLGYAEAGREMLVAGHAGADLAKSPAMPENVVVPFAQIKQVTNAVILGSIILAALTFFARFIRLTVQKTQEVILVRDGGPEMISTSALSMLDGFHRNDQLHANLCAGRGTQISVKLIIAMKPIQHAEGRGQDDFRATVAYKDHFLRLLNGQPDEPCKKSQGGQDYRAENDGVCDLLDLREGHHNIFRHGGELSAKSAPACPATSISRPASA